MIYSNRDNGVLELGGCGLSKAIQNRSALNPVQFEKLTTRCNFSVEKRDKSHTEYDALQF
jgi:hypothetical protein